MKHDGIAAVLREYKDPVSLDQMTLRDFFAAMVSMGSASKDPQQTAKQAYAVAEALLDERAK
jgi:hypothetical protein